MNGMNPWCAAAVSLVCSWAFACSSNSASEPSGHAGESNAGAAVGGASGGSAGAASQAGGGSANGGNAGSVTAGSDSGGMPVGGTDHDSAGAPDPGGGGSGGAPPSGPYEAVGGRFCPVESTIGVVELMGFPSPYVQVSLFDQPDPWIGEAELSTATCEFHRYKPGSCGGCEAGETCSSASVCQPERRTIKNASLSVETVGSVRHYDADPQLGGIYSTLDIGDASSSYAMTLSWDETVVVVAATPVAGDDLANLAIRTASGNSDKPGALDATWDVSTSEAFVRSRIPINHHAGGPTFTECRAPVSAGAFHADAEMIDPLAVQTGLEFQGVEHEFVAAAVTPQGCVEFRFGSKISAFPNL